jgi:Leucine-rich repeat (LRR) protein
VGISNLKALTHLHIFDNQLTTIPEWIVSLPNLKRLDLRGNNQLPTSPALIDRLSELETRGCVVKYPDQISIEARANRAKSRQEEELKLRVYILDTTNSESRLVLDAHQKPFPSN